MKMKKKDRDPLERVFRRPGPREYHAAGTAVKRLVAEAGPGHYEATLGALSKDLGVSVRTLGYIQDVSEKFDEDMLERAEEMGARWTHVREFLKGFGRKQKPAMEDLEELEAIVAKGRRRGVVSLSFPRVG